MAGVNMLELVQLSEQFSKTASPGRGGAGGGGGGHGSASTGAAKAEAASGGAAVASAAAAFGAASPSAAAGSGGKAAGAFSAGLGGAFVARAAARLKAKAAKAVKSRYYLRMQPLDDDHPPIGLPLRELLIQTFNYKRDRTMWEFLVYAVYVAVFLAVVYQLNDTQLTQNANGNVFDAFLDESMTSLWSDATPLQPPQNGALRSPPGCMPRCLAGAVPAERRQAGTARSHNCWECEQPSAAARCACVAQSAFWGSAASGQIRAQRFRRSQHRQGRFDRPCPPPCSPHTTLLLLCTASFSVLPSASPSSPCRGDVSEDVL